MRNEMTSELSDLPRKVADRIASKCWSVPREDLRQEAELVALTAAKNYDPEKGDLRGYLYGAISRHLINYVYDAGTPVSYKHRRSMLKDIRSAELKEVSATAAPDDVFADVEYARWRVRVIARAEVLAGEEAPAVIPCLFEDATPADAAKKFGLPLMRVMEAVGRVTEAMQEDREMISLYQEL